jgi:hypothetical protein
MSAANGKAKDIDRKRIEKLWICDRSNAMRQDIKKLTQIFDRSNILQFDLFIVSSDSAARMEASMSM